MYSIGHRRGAAAYAARGVGCRPRRQPHSLARRPDPRHGERRGSAHPACYPRQPSNPHACQDHPREPLLKKTILLYGLLGGALIAALKMVEYRYLVLEHSLELYGGIVAVLFSVVGIWLGQKLTRPRERLVVREVPVRVEVRVAVPAGGSFVRNQERVRELGITPRELEILEALAAGLSNKEIADRLFVSENTVKTHAARVFAKLSARRRTQAVQLAKEAGIIA